MILLLRREVAVQRQHQKPVTARKSFADARRPAYFRGSGQENQNVAFMFFFDQRLQCIANLLLKGFRGIWSVRDRQIEQAAFGTQNGTAAEILSDGICF